MVYSQKFIATLDFDVFALEVSNPGRLRAMRTDSEIRNSFVAFVLPLPAVILEPARPG